MKKNTLFIGVGVVALLGIVPSVIFGYLPWRENRALAATLLGDPRTKHDYEKILEREAKLKKNPEDLAEYTGLAFNWKEVGDTLQDKKYYQKALDAAIEGLDRYPRSALLNMNAGNLYRELGDYTNAEKRYRQAVLSAPGDPQTYLLLVDLFRYMKKPELEIVQVYQEGLGRLLNGLPLLNSYADYLRQSGQKQRALQFYQELVKAVPNNKEYKQVVEDIERELAIGR